MRMVWPVRFWMASPTASSLPRGFRSLSRQAFSPCLALICFSCDGQATTNLRHVKAVLQGPPILHSLLGPDLLSCDGQATTNLTHVKAKLQGPPSLQSLLGPDLLLL